MSQSFDPDAIDLPKGHFISGQLVPAQAGMDLRRPSDGKTFATCPIADASVVDQAVDVAKAAMKSSGWGQYQPRDRTRALHRWAYLIEAEALARLEAVASTRLISQIVAGDIAVTAEQIRFSPRWPTTRAAIWCRRRPTSWA